MKVSQLLDARREQWRELESLSRELEARGIATVRLTPPSPSSVTTPHGLARAWEILNEPPVPPRLQRILPTDAAD